jgi:hypothetical protein
LISAVVKYTTTTAIQQNVFEIKVQYTSIPVGLICFDPFSEACGSYS